MRHLTTIVALTGVSVAMATAHAADLPFRDANQTEINSLTGAGVIATPLNQTNFGTGATVTVQKLTSSSSSKTLRGSQAASGGVYKAAISAGADPHPNQVPPNIVPTDFIDYEDNHDAVQAWGYVGDLGQPFVMVYADGKAKGQSAASWSTAYVVPGTGNRDVYAQFKVPAAHFKGRFLDAALSNSWARLRIDFLVDAYPAWSTEAQRFNEIYEVLIDPVNVVYQKRERVRIDSFGASIGFDSTHPDTTSQLITVKLGNYPAGKVLDLTLLYQAKPNSIPNAARIKTAVLK